MNVLNAFKQHYRLPTAAKSICWNEPCVLLAAVVATVCVSVFVTEFGTAPTDLVSSSAEADGLASAVGDDVLDSAGFMVVVFTTVLDPVSVDFVSSSREAVCLVGAVGDGVLDSGGVRVVVAASADSSSASLVTEENNKNITIMI